MAYSFEIVSSSTSRISSIPNALKNSATNFLCTRWLDFSDILIGLGGESTLLVALARGDVGMR